MIKDLGKGKYRLIVNIGSGKGRKRPSKTVYCNGIKEARKLYTQFEAECDKTPAADITVEELLDSYIAHAKTLGRKATTLHGYEVAAKRLYPSVGDISASKCTTYRLEKEIALMSDNGLASKTIKNTITLLSAAYDHAIAIGQLESNPCKKLVLPKGQPRPVRILYRDEIQDFLYALADVDLNEKVAYELALFLGLRRSEILGLKESDVDILHGMISIHNTRHRVKRETINQNTKTDRSTRTLALPDILITDIARLLVIHNEFRYEKTDYLIQDGFGNTLNPQALSSRLSRLEEKKHLPHVTLHGLRHTYASLLHSEGVDMAVISAELGHSNMTTTANIYTHIFNEPTNASRGVAKTINDFNNGCGKLDFEGVENSPSRRKNKNSATFLPHAENKKPSKR